MPDLAALARWVDEQAILRELAKEPRDRRPLWQRALWQRGQRVYLAADLIDPPCMFCGGGHGSCHWCETARLEAVTA